MADILIASVVMVVVVNKRRSLFSAIFSAEIIELPEAMQVKLFAKGHNILIQLRIALSIFVSRYQFINLAINMPSSSS